MFNFDIDSWGAKPKKERKRIEELEEGDLDDIEEVERKPRQRRALVAKVRDEFKIQNFVSPSAVTVLKTCLTAYKSQYQRRPHAIERLKALCEELGLDFDSDLVVASVTRRQEEDEDNE